jgi:hypothetical protein
VRPPRPAGLDELHLQLVGQLPQRRRALLPIRAAGSAKDSLGDIKEVARGRLSAGWPVCLDLAGLAAELNALSSSGADHSALGASELISPVF